MNNNQAPDEAAVSTPRTYEPTHRRLTLDATTDIPLLVPELSRQMMALAKEHGFDTFLGVEVEVRMVFSGKVSRENVNRLLLANDCGIYAKVDEVAPGN